LLNVFGEAYSTEGTALLRWLSLATIPNVLVVVALGLARVQNRPLFIAAIQGLLGVMTLALTYILLNAFGVAGAGLAWLISQTIGAGLVGVWLIWLRQRRSAVQVAADSSGALFERRPIHD
jgi:O-antigen/teichoic acid export membrane protein